MAYRRGFKAEANWLSSHVRDELGIPAHLPLCPWRLAEHLGFPVIDLTAYEASEPEMVRYFRSAKGQEDFSAITLFMGTTRFIIHNDAHSKKRQAANIAHELAHGLLLHPPKPAFDEAGSRHYDKNMEDEANWLGPALLVSDEAAMHIARLRLPMAAASDMYGASVQLVQMRLNVSGALIRVSRRAAS